MNDVVEAALRLVEPLASRNAVALERRIDAEPDETTVRADESELLQIVINLLLNALEAAPEGSVRITLDRDADDLRLRVQDDGQGMTRDQRAHAFDPFVSSRARAGLGLAVCQAIAERHHAVIDAHSDGPGQGSVFTLRIPAPVSEAAP
jgi:signal transduction histidine kinase